MPSEIENARLLLSRTTDAMKKSRFGQYLTPGRTAAFMAGLFPDAAGRCRLLDAGAGIGSLSAAFLDRWVSGGFRFESVDLDAYEIDPSLNGLLRETLGGYARSGFTARIVCGDFIHAVSEAVATDLFAVESPRYTHAILNPPYKKISSHSAHRHALRRVGIETVNLYSAFVALAVAQGEPGAQVVAIIPRSFCNGPYYRPFREFLLERAAIRHIHLFKSRVDAFSDDNVLQENVIIRLECGGKTSAVTISTSTNDTFADLEKHQHAFNRIVLPDDAQRFIHIPTSQGQSAIERSSSIRSSLKDLDVAVSTGPVVDFRLRQHLRPMPEEGTVPLLYPGHFTQQRTRWPIAGMKKPNAIVRNEDTERWLYPAGFYCVVRRFSSKEEVRRIVASVVEPSALGGASVIGFENHLNVFHERKRGLPKALAHGLATYLNSSAIDDAFRRFNGHTQVNAADLALMKYPSRDVLIELGEWAIQQQSITQEMIDHRFVALAA